MWMFFMWLVTTVVGELLRPKPKFNTPQPAGVGDFQVTTAEVGRPVPAVYGRALLKGANCVWFGDIKTEAITEKVRTGMFSKKTITKGYKYYMGAQLAFCHGFSPSAVAAGSGLVELRLDDKRFTALDAPAEGGGGGGLIGVANANWNKALYQTDVVDGADATKRHVRVRIKDDNFFGGEDSGGGFSGDIDFYYGQGGQERNDYLQRVIDPDISAFRGLAYAVLRQVYIGTSEYPKMLSAIVQHYPWFWGQLDAGRNIDGDANPAAIVVDLLTNKTYGLGHSFDDLDIDGTFASAASQFRAEGLGMTLVYDTQSSASDLLEDIMRHVDGVLYIDPNTGQYKLQLARPGYSTVDLLRLNADNFDEPKVVRSAWEDTKNVVKVRYTNREDNYQTGVVEVKNQSNIAVRGGVRDEDTYDFRGLSNPDAANRVAARILKTVSTPMARLSFKVNREAFSLHRGAVFMLDWPAEGISNMACRVTRVSYGDLTDPSIEVEAIEDVFGLLETQITPPQASSSWEDPTLIDVPLNAVNRLIEVPHFLVGGEDRWVMSLGSRSHGLVLGYHVDLAQGGAYVRSASSMPSTPSGVLTESLPWAVDGQDVTVNVPMDASQLVSVSSEERYAGESLVLIDDELLAFQAVTQNNDGTVTLGGVLRGMLDTVPAAHAAGARAWFISAGAGLVRDVPFEVDQVVTAGLRPFSSRGEFFGGVPTVSVTTASRAQRPLPPGRVRVNDMPAPSAVIGTAQLDWRHRSKQAQLASRTLVTQSSVDSTLEPGTSHSIEVLLDGTVVRTIDVIEGSGFSYTPAMRADDSWDGRKLVSFRLAAFKDGLVSAQKQITPPVQMTGMGMCLGESLGGHQIAA